MQFVDIPTEQTTAVTDALLAVLAVAGAVHLHRIGARDRWKTNLWTVVLALLATAAGLGAVVHGFEMSPALRAILWQPIKLSLGLLVALFIVAVVYDLWGPAPARRILPVMIVSGVVFLGITRIWPDKFLVFIVYEAAAMLFALGGYIRLAWQGRRRGAWLMAGGILTTIAAAAIQAGRLVTFTFIWPFDHNGVYHLIQMAGIVLIVAGLRRDLRPG
jgi:hypothetical protein